MEPVRQTKHGKQKIILNLDKNTKVKGKGIIRELIMRAGGRGFSRGNNTSNTVSLSTVASTIPNDYIGKTIFIMSGKGKGQSKEITRYDAATKTVTIDSEWDVIPDESSIYQILYDVNGTIPLRDILAIHKMNIVTEEKKGNDDSVIAVDTCSWLVNIVDNTVQIVKSSIVNHVELFDTDLVCSRDKNYEYVLTVMCPKENEDEEQMETLMSNILEASLARIAVPIVEVYTTVYLGIPYYMFIRPTIICTLSQYITILKTRDPEIYRRIQKYMPTRVDPRYRLYDFDAGIQETIYNLLYRIERGSIPEKIKRKPQEAGHIHIPLLKAKDIVLCRNQNVRAPALAKVSAYYRGYNYSTGRREHTTLAYTKALCNTIMKRVIKHGYTFDPNGVIVKLIKMSLDDDAEFQLPEPNVSRPPSQIPSAVPSPARDTEPLYEKDIEIRSPVSVSTQQYLTTPKPQAAKRAVSPSSSTQRMEPEAKLSYTTRYFENTPSSTLEQSKSVLSELRGYVPPSISTGIRGIPLPERSRSGELRQLGRSFEQRMRALENEDDEKEHKIETDKPVDQSSTEIYQALSTVVSQKHRSALSQQGVQTGSTQSYREYMLSQRPGSYDSSMLHDLTNAETRRFLPIHRYEFEGLNRALGTDISEIQRSRRPPPPQVTEPEETYPKPSEKKRIDELD